MADITRTELAGQIAEDNNLKKSDVDDILEAAFTLIEDHLADGESVGIIDFGSFKVRTRKARRSRNPSNGEVIQVPERKGIKFTPGKGLRDAVRGE